jgi:hypothetical protein
MTKFLMLAALLNGQCPGGVCPPANYGAPGYYAMPGAFSFPQSYSNCYGSYAGFPQYGGYSAGYGYSPPYMSAPQAFYGPPQVFGGNGYGNGTVPFYPGNGGGINVQNYGGGGLFGRRTPIFIQQSRAPWR